LQGASKKNRNITAYFITGVFFLGVSSVTNLATFAITGKSGIPTLKFDNPFGFFAMWTIQAMFVIYSGIIFVLLDIFMCSLLILICGHFEHLAERVKTMKPAEVEEVVAMHFEIKE
jgi:hypothetical protein